MSNAELNAMLNARAQARAGSHAHDFVQTNAQLSKYSDELANGDRDDDKEVEFEHDMTD